MNLPLDKMTIAEKLQAMEDLWDDLRRTPDVIPSPEWHADVLAERKKAVEEGRSEFQDWGSAKEDIRRAVK